MTRAPDKQAPRPDRQGPRAGKPASSKAPPVPAPVGVVDGMPDRTSRPARWKLAILAAIFLAWVAFLAIVALTGALR